MHRDSIIIYYIKVNGTIAIEYRPHKIHILVYWDLSCVAF